MLITARPAAKPLEPSAASAAKGTSAAKPLEPSAASTAERTSEAPLTRALLSLGCDASDALHASFAYERTDGVVVDTSGGFQVPAVEPSASPAACVPIAELTLRFEGAVHAWDANDEAALVRCLADFGQISAAQLHVLDRRAGSVVLRIGVSEATPYMLSAPLPSPSAAVRGFIDRVRAASISQLSATLGVALCEAPTVPAHHMIEPIAPSQAYHESRMKSQYQGLIDQHICVAGLSPMDDDCRC